MAKSAAPPRVKLWVGTQDNPDDRTIIEVTPAAKLKIDTVLLSGGIFQCRDYITNKIVRLKRADCGLDCQRVCAIEFAERAA